MFIASRSPAFHLDLRIDHRLAKPSAAAISAGVTTFIWYLFGAAPLLIVMTSKMGLSEDVIAGWFFITMFSSAVVSLPVAVLLRQPIQIGWTAPGLIFLVGVAGRYSLAEIAGANLMSGVLIAGLGPLGIGRKIMVWLPAPITLGMFAGGILGSMFDLVQGVVIDPIIAGSAVIGFLLGKAINHRFLPPVGVAVFGATTASFLSGSVQSAPVPFALPPLALVEVRFSVDALIAVSLPLVVLSIGLGNVQGFGFLQAQGYSVRVSLLTVLTGLTSIANALFGGHPSTIARAGTAMMGSADAGPLEGRFWASVVANVLTIPMALSASTVAALTGIMPKSYLLAIGGLAILSAFQDAMEKTFAERSLRLGAIGAFLAAATPFTVIGIPSAFWALPIGIAISLVAEREALLEHWRTS